MVGSFGFSIALLPAVRADKKPPKLTCGMTGSILVLFCTAYSTLGLWAAFSVTLLTCTLWFILLVQQLILGVEADRVVR